MDEEIIQTEEQELDHGDLLDDENADGACMAACCMWIRRDKERLALRMKNDEAASSFRIKYLLKERASIRYNQAQHKLDIHLAPYYAVAKLNRLRKWEDNLAEKISDKRDDVEAFEHFLFNVKDRGSVISPAEMAAAEIALIDAQHCLGTAKRHAQQLEFRLKHDKKRIKRKGKISSLANASWDRVVAAGTSKEFAKYLSSGRRAGQREMAASKSPLTEQELQNDHNYSWAGYDTWTRHLCEKNKLQLVQKGITREFDKVNFYQLLKAMLKPHLGNRGKHYLISAYGPTGGHAMACSTGTGTFHRSVTFFDPNGGEWKIRCSDRPYHWIHDHIRTYYDDKYTRFTLQECK